MKFHEFVDRAMDIASLVFILCATCLLVALGVMVVHNLWR
jgi:hypothetical protein